MNKLWVDKYRATNLDDYILNPMATRAFQSLAKQPDLSHLIVEGISGVGKKSCVMAFLKRVLNNYGLFGEDVYKIQNVTIPLKYPNKMIDLNIQKSLYHYNLNPSNYNIYDRHIVQDFLKSQFKYQSLTSFPYKFVIIRHAERLSLDAQQSLRRTLEKCIKNARFIFMVDTDHRGGLIAPLLSRCVRIRMSCLTPDQAVSHIQSILQAEKLTVSDSLIRSLFKKSGSNLTKTINFLQIMSVCQPHLLAATSVKLDQIDPVTSTCHQILHLFNSQNISAIIEIRSLLYRLLTHGISPEEIIKKICNVVLNSLPGQELAVVQITNQVEEMLTRSSREFYHLENYIIQLLILVKSYEQSKHTPPQKKKKTVLHLK